MKKLFALVVLAAIYTGCGNYEELTILHVNDTHSHFLEHEKDDTVTGGAGRLYTFIQNVRSDADNLLLLHAGDFITGTVFSAVYQGDVNIDLFNRMKFDILSPGNHEFDYGLSNLLRLSKMADFPFISATLLNKDSDDLMFSPYIITNIAGASVVIIGLTTSDWGVYQPMNKTDFDIRSEYIALSNLLYTTALAETNDLVMLLSHCGNTEDIAFAETFPEIDVIIGGHSHTKMSKVVHSGNALIVQAGSNSDYIGELDLFIHDGKIKKYRYSLNLLGEEIVSDSDIESFIADNEQIIIEKFSTKICDSSYFLDNAELRTECVPLGNFVADVLNHYAEADFSIVNAGMIRNYIPDGEILQRHLLETYPFDNPLYVVTLKGSSVKEIIARGVERLGYGAFLYYSEGFQVDVDADGHFSATFNGEEIQDDQVYTVGVDGFLYNGGDLYYWFADDALTENEAYPNIRELLIEYLGDLGTLVEGNVGTEKRVIFAS